MALENINTRMELYIKGNGKMINKMEKVFKYGQMDKNMKGNLIWASNQEKEFLNLTMDPFIKATFPITKFMEKVIFFLFRRLYLVLKSKVYRRLEK